MTGPAARADIVVVGEGMLELRGAADGWTLGHGGDTLNTAIHLARAGLRVRYATALGDDPLSDGLRRAWRAEGLDLDLTGTVAGRLPGLYAIHVDEAGERSFSYWRDGSAARAMLAGPDADRLCEQAATADLLHYSLITLAILPEPARARLLDLCRRVRAAGGQVSFDGNYRPRLWPDAGAARAARDRALATCDIGLPTLDDERLLDGSETAGQVVARWRSAGVAEIVVKTGRDGCVLGDGTAVRPAINARVVDSSGAGDAFDAGYLAARLRGAAPAAAAAAGHRYAYWTITRPGAIPARDEAAPYAVELA